LAYQLISYLSAMSHASTILIVDDNRKQKEKLEHILKSLPFTVICTDTQEKAFDIMRYTEVAVLLLDFSLTGSTVQDFMQRLKSDTITEDTFVIAVVDDKHSFQEALQSYKSGIVDSIEKPFSPDMVRSIVQVFVKLYIKSKKVKHLLNNILPAEIAYELEETGRVKPKRYGLATMLFTDFVAFSQHTKQISPVELVNQLDSYFAAFDKIIKKYSLEKIKTIGDAYMCVAGVPEKRKENPILAVLAAYEINLYMHHLKGRNKQFGKKTWQLRIGLHSGPLVAGVIGKSKFAYDVWGDTVNIASRICSWAEPGRVNISAITYERVKEYFDCSYRGELEAKNIGLVGMYHVDKIKPQYSMGEAGIKPNKEFMQAAGLIFIQYPRLFDYLVKRMKNELAPELYYHGVHHTLDVINSVQKIARDENLDDDEHLLLNTAALLHDSGYIFTYHHNEELAIKMARKILPDYGYTPNQIQVISGIIRTTKIRSKPKTHLQMIMNDADYDYLGRKDYPKVAATLHKELLAQGLKISKEQWIKMQIRFLEKHTFYTEFSKQNRQRQKLANLARLIRSLSKV
jgi:adenylate cyclase